MHELAKSALSLDEAVGDTLLSAESGEEDHQFDGVNVVSDDNELSLAFLNQLGHVVEPELDVDGLGGLELLLVVLLSLGFLQESCLLLLFGFGFVLCK